jgi:hypothetical protein
MHLLQPWSRCSVWKTLYAACTRTHTLLPQCKTPRNAHPHNITLAPMYTSSCCMFTCKTVAPQVPALNIFETSFRRGKFDESRKLSNGGMLDFAHIYPMDAVFDTPEDVPEEVRLLRCYITCYICYSTCSTLRTSTS